MELFSIICTTCKSRLKVRDQAAIGQILACPKCGGMVMVKSPPAFHEASEQRSDVPTATELSTPVGPRFDETLDSSAFDVVDELLSDAPPKVQQPAAAATPPTPAAPVPPKPRFVGGPKSARPSATPPPEAGAIPPPPPTPTAPAKPASAGRTNTRHWLFIAGSVGLGVALASAAVTATIITLRGSRGPVRSAKLNPIQQPPEGPQPNSPDSRSVIELPGDVASAAPGTPSFESTPRPERTSPVENTTTKAPAIAASADPIGIVQPPAANGGIERPKTSELARFDRLLDGGSDDPLAHPPTGQTAAAPPPDPDTSPAKPLAPRPPPREVDVAKRLNDPLLGIQTAGTPLADFLQLLSDLSTIPMTLDLPLTPATADSQVVLKLANTTVGGALDEGLKPLRLEKVVANGQLVVRRVEPEKFLPVRHAVKDLTGGDESQLAELAEIFKATVEPEAWKEESGSSLEVDPAEGQLVITQRRGIQLQVLIAIEKLRAARRPKLPHILKLDNALFQATTRYAQAAANLEKSVTFNFSQSARLVTILERLSETTGTRIVVDWQDVESAGWNPAAEARLLVNGKPLAEALDALLDPLDLAWRVIDGRTIQVVTPSRLASQGEFELYPVESLVVGSDGEALLNRIRVALAKALASETGDVRYEKQSKCVLAWLPQPHQQVLELLLAQWKAEAGK